MILNNKKKIHVNICLIYVIFFFSSSYFIHVEWSVYGAQYEILSE